MTNRGYPASAHVIIVKTTGLSLMFSGGDPVRQLTIEMRRENWRTPEDQGGPGADPVASTVEVRFALYADGDCVPGQLVAVSDGATWAGGIGGIHASVYPLNTGPENLASNPTHDFGAVHDELHRAIREHVLYLAATVHVGNLNGPTANPRHLTLSWDGVSYQRAPEGWIDGLFGPE